MHTLNTNKIASTFLSTLQTTILSSTTAIFSSTLQITDRHIHADYCFLTATIFKTLILLPAVRMTTGTPPAGVQALLVAADT